MTRAQAPTQSAVVPFDAAAAGRNLTALVDARRGQLANLLAIEDPESDRGRAILDRFITVALHAATSKTDILKATPESVIESIRNAALLGLEPVGVTGDGAIVVYGNVASFQPMYRGLLKLARRSEQIAYIDAHVVYAADKITLLTGSNPEVRHEPELDGTKRGKYVGAYAVAELANGRRYVDWMSEADIEVVRKSSRASANGPWVSHWAEMARKTVLRRLLKRLPLETTAEHALRLENEAEERAVTPAPTVAPASDARRRIAARFSEPLPDEDGGATPPDPQAGTPEPDPAPVLGDPTGETPCGAPSPYREGEGCTLDKGHGGPHGDGEKASWL